MVLGLLLAGLLSLPASAQDEGGPGAFQSACFHGLNDADTPATIPPCDSGDLLNVESNLQGTAFLKRKGFSVTASLTCSTCPITGSHSYVDSSGNKLDIVCYNRYCAKSTNGNAFADFLTVAASSATRWSWVDAGGIAYGGNNAYDPILKYDGTTVSRPSGMPKGSILELTQDRLVVADIQSQPNRVHYSSAGALEQFTTGANPEDSYFDDLGAPGDKTRGLKHLSGFLYIFKTASITGCELGDQYTSRCAVISPSLGTTDPASIVTAGSSLYFRAQDKNYWELSSSGLTQISKKIPNLVKSQSGGLGGGENSNLQTTQADWQAGVQSDTGTFDTATLPGSIFPASFTFIDQSTANFASGDLTWASTSSVLRAGVLFDNSGFEKVNANNWTETGSGPFVEIGANCGSSSAGSFTGGGAVSLKACNAGSSVDAKVELIKASDSTVLYRNSNTATTGCNTASFDASTQTVAMKVRFTDNISGGTFTSPSFSTFSLVGGVFRYGFGGRSGGCIPGGGGAAASSMFDTYDPYFIPSSTFVSRAFNTTFSTPTWGVFSASVTVPNGSFNFASQASANGSSWDAAVSLSTNGRINSAGKSHVRYIAYIYTASETSAPSISSAGFNHSSTGTFRTQCIQPNTAITAWGSLICADQLVGNGSLVYYATSAATCATLPSGNPTTWQTSVTNNGTLSIATNTAVYIGWRSLLGSATDQAQVDACTLNWNEGTPVQPAWAVYDSIKNAIFWTTTINNAAYSNRLLKYDRNLKAWYPFSIAAQAPRIINNSLYFGGASSGTWAQYGLVDSDDGGAINGYWESKDAGGDSPFTEKQFQTASILSRNNQAGSMTATWTLSNAETDSYSISLSTGVGITYARSNFNLPITSPQNFIRIRIGNNNTTPFEILGLGITWTNLPWSVGGP